MPNIQCYWDGNSGSIVYDKRMKVYTSKMEIPNVTYDRLNYSSDDNIAKKIVGDTLSDLNGTEIAAIEAFVNENAEEQVLVAGDITKHNSDPTAHPDIRQELSELFEHADRVCYVATHEAKVPLTGTFTYTPSMVVADYGINASNGSFVAPADETYRIDYRLSLSNITGYSGSGGSITVELLKNNSVSLFSMSVDVTGDLNRDFTRTSVMLAEGDTISVRLTFNNMGGEAYMVPFRNFLSIANHGNTTAYNIGKTFFDTLGNLVFYSGYELAIRPDDNQKPSAIAGTWNNTVS